MLPPTAPGRFIRIRTRLFIFSYLVLVTNCINVAVFWIVVPLVVAEVKLAPHRAMQQPISILAAVRISNTTWILFVYKII
jgi:hypothetical protein